jgi:hypothetical protein
VQHTDISVGDGLLPDMYYMTQPKTSMADTHNSMFLISVVLQGTQYVTLEVYWLVCWPLHTKVAGSKRWIFKGDKNPQHTFLSDGK